MSQKPSLPTIYSWYIDTYARQHRDTDVNIPLKAIKTGCKTYFFACASEFLPVILSSLTKQHNLFYTLKN